MKLQNSQLKFWIKGTWLQVKTLRNKSTSLETIFFAAKEGNQNSYLSQAHLDNNHLKLC